MIVRFQACRLIAVVTLAIARKHLLNTLMLCKGYYANHRWLHYTHSLRKLRRLIGLEIIPKRHSTFSD